MSDPGCHNILISGGRGLGNLYMSSIKLAWQTERLAGLSDHGSNLPCLTTWVGRVLLSPVTYGDLLSFSFKKSCRTLSLSLSYYYYLGGVSVSWLVGAGVGESIHELNFDGMILIFTWFTSLLNFWRGVVTREMLQGPFIIHDVGLENLIILTFSAILQPRLAHC